VGCVGGCKHTALDYYAGTFFLNPAFDYDIEYITELWKKIRSCGGHRKSLITIVLYKIIN
jgi:hypothetical protein